MDKNTKVCIVTGAGAGIGKGIAETFAANGYLSVIATRTKSQGIETAKELTDKGYQAVFIQLDVSDIEQCQDVVDKIMNDYGRIDCLVNNAGVTFFKELENITEEDWDNVMSVDLKGLFFMSQYVSKYMIQQKSGSIINIASNHPRATIRNAELYVSAKSAVIGLTKGMSLTLGEHNVRVNVISPGFTNTPHHVRWMQELNSDVEHVERQVLGVHALSRICEPRDIGKLALFLASEDSFMITGENIVMDGGLSNILLSDGFYRACKSTEEGVDNEI